MTSQHIGPANSFGRSAFGCLLSGIGELLVLCLLAGALSCHAAPAGEAADAGGIEIIHGPFVQAPSETGMTISWATSRKAVSRVEYRAETSSQWLTNIPSHYGLVDADETRHNVTLQGLKPGERYVYRAVSREIVDFRPYQVSFGATVCSAEHRFTTLDRRKAGFSFVVVNDRHENIDGLRASWRSVDWNGVDLAFLNGDMVNAVRDEQQFYRVIVDPCVESFASGIPLVYARGNHDTRGSFARRLLDYFPTESGRYYYMIRHGPVAFLVLDCGEDKADASEEYSGLAAFGPYMEQERAWLAGAIRNKDFQKAKFRICLIHIPPADKADAKFVKPKWLWSNFGPLLNRGKVDLLISGHTHSDAVQAAGVDGLQFPILVGGAETVIRCDVSGDEVRITNTALNGTVLPRLAPIKAR